jgi:NADH-quinone oxidoreductase subunit K
MPPHGTHRQDPAARCVRRDERPAGEDEAEPGRKTGRQMRRDHADTRTFLTLGALLFAPVTGIFLNRKNVIILLMCIELMLLAVNMNFVAFSRFLGNLDGQVFVFFILTVAAAEAAIGLAILVRSATARPSTWLTRRPEGLICHLQQSFGSPAAAVAAVAGLLATRLGLVTGDHPIRRPSSPGCCIQVSQLER